MRRSPQAGPKCHASLIALCLMLNWAGTVGRQVPRRIGCARRPRSAQLGRRIPPENGYEQESRLCTGSNLAMGDSPFIFVSMPWLPKSEVCVPGLSTGHRQQCTAVLLRYVYMDASEAFLDVFINWCMSMHPDQYMFMSTQA